MSEWAPKRFWDKAATAETEGGFTVELDGRPVRTPAKSALALPTRALADAIAAEWDAQVEKVDPSTMPFTRSANAAVDKVTPQHAEVADMLAAYGETDLLCYRATDPQELAARQEAEWAPYLARAADEFAAPLAVTAGIVPVTQPTQSLHNLAAQVHACPPFVLTALHDMVALTGSLVLGLGCLHRWADPAEIWRLSRIDEEWQIEQWGRDEEADALADSKFAELQHSVRFAELIAS
ncbi:ATPase [Actibacterium mucosum KCTC 23349]|uniref:ATPase n=1 Tax=Actibacterium mucosum KCTC 23349 TaxID=1454373 RepID=A0A037ZGY4_9RHOB|nr:ATP12 family protein [Actibacterium mucosum]KAJ54796.1 ATPase [Actibacterium mucosum KCTC 23349]